MRPISLTLQAAANAEETGDELIFLATISHDELPQPFHLSSHPTALISTDPLRWGTVSRGTSYDFAPMTVQLPEDSDEAAPAMQLVLENVSRQVIPLLRSVSTPALVTVELLLRSDLDQVEAVWPEFDLVGASYTAEQVTLELGVNALAGASWPSGVYSPAGFGGLF